MKRIVASLLIALLTVCVTMPMASAAGQGPKEKLAAPANVTCPLTAEGVLVSFDLVDGANAYQVEFVCVNALGEFREESVFGLASPILIVEEDCTVQALHVRAMPVPKHAGGPLQGVGPKGLWSESCVVGAP